MTTLFKPRYLRSLQNINKSFIINSFLHRNIQHGRALSSITHSSAKKNERLAEAQRINKTLLTSPVGANLFLKFDFTTSAKWCLKKNETETKKDELETTQTPAKPKLGIVARFKDLAKKYWYVLLPVHVVTSAGWIACFYFLSTSGVDMVALLQSLSISETIIDKLKDSTMGHVAITYMLYKIATPLRYTVTIGGTTISIKYLSQWGYIKPLPSKDELQQLYDDKKAQMRQSFDDKKAQLKQDLDDKKAQMKQGYDEQKSKIIESIQNKTKFKN